MTKRAEQLLEQLLHLPPEDRVELADKLYESIEPSDDPEYMAAWEVELRERIAEMDRGDVTPIPWEQVRERLGQDDGHVAG